MIAMNSTRTTRRARPVPPNARAMEHTEYLGDAGPWNGAPRRLRASRAGWSPLSTAMDSVRLPLRPSCNGVNCPRRYRERDQALEVRYDKAIFSATAPDNDGSSDASSPTEGLERGGVKEGRGDARPLAKGDDGMTGRRGDGSRHASSAPLRAIDTRRGECVVSSGREGRAGPPSPDSARQHSQSQRPQPSPPQV